jgi:hypothetical protein
VADLNVAIRLSATDQASPAIGKVTREVAGIGTAAEGSSSKIGGLTSVLAKVGLATAGIQAVTGAVLGLGKAMIDPIMAASDLEESQNKVNVVFGSSAKTITDFAKTSAQDLGLSRAAALAATGTFGNLFTSMGLGQKEAAGLSTKVVTLASDLASFNNVSPEEALEKLRAGLVGEAEPLRSLGINLNEDAVAAEAMRLGLAKSKKEVSDSAKIQARYSLILKQSTNAQGDFKNTSSGMANSIRIIKASFADLQEQIGERLLPVIAPLVSQFAKLLPRAMDALRPYLDRAGAAIRGVADAIGRIVTSIRENGVIATLMQLGREIGPALLEGLRAAQGFAGDVVAWLREQVGRIDWAGIWAGAKNVGAGLVQRLGDIASQVTAWLAQQWSRIEWGGVWTSVTGFATGLADGLGDVWRVVTTWIAGQWARIDWEAVWKSVQGHGAALVTTLAPITKDVEAWLVAQFDAVDWVSVWRTAQAGSRLPDGLIAVMRSADTQPLGRAIGFFLVDAIREAVRLATGTDGGFAGADALMAVAFVRSMVGFPGRVLVEARAIVVRLLGDIFEGAVERLDLTPFWTALKAKVAAAVALVFPIKVGPLTLGLGGVSVDTSGINRAVENVVSPAPAGGTATGGGSVPAFANGGSFRVGGAGGTDSQMVRFRASPGEVVAVGHARRGGGGGPTVVNQTFNVANRSDAEYLADVLPDALARALEKARSQQGLPVVSGLTRFN